MVGFFLYVEGGGKGDLRDACRQGFSMFLSRAGLAGKMPRIYACGGRQEAYKDFVLALQQGRNAFLLVDSEGPVPDSCSSPWDYLSNRSTDAWECPNGVGDERCHLMVQIMESWFLTDKNTLENFLGQLPGNYASRIGNNVEIFPKEEVLKCLGSLSYDKKKHSFKLLERIDPQKVMQSSPWAKRFVDTLAKEGNGAKIS